MNSKFFERAGFYISRLSLFGFVIIGAYLLFLTKFVIHPESEVSMITTLPLFIGGIACGAFILIGESIRLITFMFCGFPKNKRVFIIHFILLFFSAWLVLPFLFNISFS